MFHNHNDIRGDDAEVRDFGAEDAHGDVRPDDAGVAGCQRRRGTSRQLT